MKVLPIKPEETLQPIVVVASCILKSKLLEILIHRRDKRFSEEIGPKPVQMIHFLKTEQPKLRHISKNYLS